MRHTFATELSNQRKRPKIIHSLLGHSSIVQTMDTYSRLLDDVDGGEVGLPEIRFHDLRHTCATLLITKGVHPKIVSEMLWRLSVSITLDIYCHVIPGLGEAAGTAMEQALGE